MERPLDIIPAQDCCGCEACVNICPKNCIEMRDDELGFRRPMIDKSACIHCNRCELVCPILNRSPKDNANTEVFACKNRDEYVRAQSSSGGIFSALAGRIIAGGGTVYGAAFDEALRVVHRRIDSLSELSDIRGSKYVQSIVGYAMRDVRTDLRQGRKVLFSGTPCQIAGLRSYLGKQYDNLYCVEVVCHGVPNPAIFRHYVSQLERQAGAKLLSIDFRNKANGWQAYETVARFADGSETRVAGHCNPYIRGFIANLYIRPSCTDCRFKSFASGADITLGDFWGSSIFSKEYNDDKGISLVCISSKKGRELFDAIASEVFDPKSSSVDVAAAYNPCLLHSVKPHRHSRKFYRQYRDSDFDMLVDRLLHESKWRKNIMRVKEIINRIIHKIL